MTHRLAIIATFHHVLQLIHDCIFGDCILLLRVPVGHSRQIFFPEESIEDFRIPLIGWEKEEQILDISSLERRREVIDRLVSEI